MDEKKPFRDRTELYFLVALLLYVLTVVRTAWLSDDAMITLRTVMNFTHGFGPNFNIDERVQAYTHPLWFLILSALALLPGKITVSSIILSAAISIFCFWLFWEKVPTNKLGGLIAVFSLLFSKSFLDFSTSGLENPLAHLLILTMLILGLKALEKKELRWLTAYFLNCSLMFLIRPDLLLVAFPLTVYIGLKYGRPSQILTAFLIGAVPAVAWLLFSLFYYGYPLPNTAYAKLGTGIPRLEYFRQGLLYYLNAGTGDPLTLFVIFCGLVFGLTGPALNRCLALGLLLYLVYIVYIGGDFMAGRFLTVPLLLAAAIIARSEFQRRGKYLMLTAVGLLCLFNLPKTVLTTPDDETRAIINGIADERNFYAFGHSLLSGLNELTMPDWVDDRAGSSRIVRSGCGFLGKRGLAAGPSVYYIDHCALADPLLSRLPTPYNPDWRIGHFYRPMPIGYKESVSFNENRLTDPGIHEMYETVRLVTRGELLDAARIKAIMRINTGRPPWTAPRYYEAYQLTAPGKDVNLPIDSNIGLFRKTD